MTKEYTMRISRLTVDKLGVKLYDKVSAVIAELISNSYDADANRVSIFAPMGQFLAKKAKGQTSDRGFEIRVVDDGIGMTPDQVQDFFLVVGAERRTDSRRGSKSPKYRRKVLGRKGVGKLAPFGICKTIEVISAGGEKISRLENGETKEGYLTAHILIDYDDIVSKYDDEKDHDLDQPYKPKVGKYDNTLREETSTQIILKNFNYRRVSEIETLSRQIAQRFGIKSDNWEVVLYDNTKSEGDADYSRSVGTFDVNTMPNTKISFQSDNRGGVQTIGPDGNKLSDIDAGFIHEDKFFKLSGWVAYSKQPYKDELMAGIRIYCRGKIASQTNVFNRRAGFTGEHSIRSYLVGEIHADWLDEDDDLIQTDRTDILWSDELGSAFQEWGQKVVRKIGTLSRDPLRKVTLDVFLETGDIEKRINQEFASQDVSDIRDKAMEIAKMLGQTISPEEAKDPETVGGLRDLSITLAPHVTLDENMRDAAAEETTPLSMLIGFLRTAKIAELSAFGRIAADRLKVIQRLETLKNAEDTQETLLQKLIEDAPWLINPEWAPVTSNQSLSTLKKEFENFYKKNTGEEISLSDFNDPSKRPDFVLSNQEGTVQIIEIKKPSHRLGNDEMKRIVNYHDLMESFLQDNANSRITEFFHDFHMTLVCDELALDNVHKSAFDKFMLNGKLTHINWVDFLFRTQLVHQDYLNEARRQKLSISSREDAKNAD